MISIRLRRLYLLTPAGEELRDGALRVEEEIASLSRKVTGQDLRLSGAVRVSYASPRCLANSPSTSGC